MSHKLDLAKFRKMLLADKERLDRERHLHQTDDSGSGVELSNYDNHPADAASETYERTKDLAIEQNFREMIEGIDEALRKIDAGTYGLCDRCGQPINIERLKVIPSATLCIECQETMERR